MVERILRSSLLLLLAVPVFADEPATGALAGTTAAHNQIRQNLNNGLPPVAGAAVQPVPCPALPDFVWSDAVALTAQTWASACTCSHEGGSPYGENIAWGGGVTGPSSAVNWASEVANPGYDYANRDCPTGTPTFPNCGHYTAVAWSTTTEVGCGFASCPAASGCGEADYVVCRYNPPGNFPGTDNDTLRPYCTATVTDECQLGGVCGGGGNPTLTVTRDGTGTGTVTSAPVGIDCGATCSAEFPSGTMVTLTQMADPGSTFAGWGGACAGTGACVVTLDVNTGVTATFNAATNACDTPAVLTCGATYNGTMSGAPSNLNDYGCADVFDQPGPDFVHTLMPPSSGTVTVDLTNLLGDLDLFVLGACDATNCTGNSENGSMDNEQVVFQATAGQTYFVVVEDWTSSGSTYDLTPTCPGCAAPNGENHTLTNGTVDDAQVYHVCDTLTVGPNYHVNGPNGNLTLRAFNQVVFTNDFSVGSGGTMTVRND